jgi:hypothetical protein
MRIIRSLLTLVAISFFTLLLCLPANAEDSAVRKEIKRVDFTGTPGMEVISSISEFKPGDILPPHFHHGIEAGTVLQGGMVQMPGKDPSAMPTATPIMMLRDVRHGGWKVAGDTNIKLFTVHIVDKGKPLYDESK